MSDLHTAKRIASFEAYDGDPDFASDLVERDQADLPAARSEAAAAGAHTSAAHSAPTKRRAPKAMRARVADITPDLADPAQVAEIIARSTSLNESLLKLARDKVDLEEAADVAAHELELRDEKIRQLEDQLLKQEQALEIAKAKLSMVDRSIRWYIERAIGYGLVAGVGSAAFFAAFAFIFL